MNTIADFYDPDLYRLELGDADDSPAAIGFYRSAVGSKPRSILDIGAGEGRIAIPLLGDGHFLICVEKSKKMFEALQASVRKHKLGRRVILLQQEFSERAIDRCADIAIAPDDFLLHLRTLPSLRKFFEHLRTWLAAGSQFVTDIRPRSAEFLHKCSSLPVAARNYGLTPCSPARPHAGYYNTTVWEVYNGHDRSLQTTYRYERLNYDGKVVTTFYRTLEQRLHTNTEILAAVAAAGFVLTENRDRYGIPSDPNVDVGGAFIFTQQ